MPALIPLAVAAATAGGSIVAAKMTSGASQAAANTNAAAQTHAADLQSQAAAQALAFQENQANLTQNNYANTQLANYAQYAQHENNIGQLGQMLGLPARQIPPPPSFLTSLATTPTSGPTTAGTTPQAAPTAATPGGNPTDPNAIAAQLQANYKSLGVAPTGPGTGPTDLAYYAQQIAATGGLTPQNSAYWFGPTGRIASDLAKASGGGGAASGGASSPYVAPMGSLMGSASPMMLPPTLQPSALPQGY